MGEQAGSSGGWFKKGAGTSLRTMHYCTTSFNKAWTQVRYLQRWESLRVVPAGNET